MLKKIMKHTLRTLAGLLLAVLLPALLYVPAVQDLVRRKAAAYASQALGMELSVERLRLSFPLRRSALVPAEGDERATGKTFLGNLKDFY